MPKDGNIQTEKYLEGLSSIITGVIVAGVLSIVIYSVQAMDVMKCFSIVSNGIMFAGACLLIGGLIGFIFGIPRTLQHDQQEQSSTKAEGQQAGSAAVEYHANTNLEQISDWLTKILVGVGLTQVREIYQGFLKLAAYMEQGLGGYPSSQSFALSILMFFLICGFLCGYLWSRLILASLMRTIDSSTLGTLKKKIEQSEIDAIALNVVYRQLDRTSDSPEVPEKELNDAVKAAAAPVKAQIFYKAQRVRSDNWREKRTKAMMERTIPVFRALVNSDTEEQFHQNYGQLGYALKDQRNPNWKDAERALSKAIEIRGDWKNHGWLLYEYSRAICRIMLDESYANGQPSKQESKQHILADLTAAANMWDAEPFFVQEPIHHWLKLNNMSTKKLLSSAAPLMDVDVE